ncbi:MAG: L-seryl-tRNA(Sec) selenium transferase [Anaerolineales bacterium]
MTLRDLPSVERLLQREPARRLIDSYGRTLAVEAIRECLDSVRRDMRDGASVPAPDDLLRRAQSSLEAWFPTTLHEVINATGVILHTNLGRAPLSRAARQALLAAAGVTPLEFDLARGTRGRREAHVEGLLCRLTGAGAALVVNNNAAAVLLALTALARRREVLVSRSQLIEIGGGFRIPDVLRQSGARLVEVGTTNRTHLEDFAQAIGPRTALLLRAHHSNFRLLGFTAEPTLAQLAELARQHGLPLLDDLGSGAVLDTSAYGLGHEPTVQESLQAGASLVAFSGDKLLGGPQAGILAGEADAVERLRRHPLYRAVRADKLCLAALRATLVNYLKGEAAGEIPVWQMIAASEDELRKRTLGWRERLGAGDLVPGRSTVGGGSLPEETLPTWLLALPARSADGLARRLRRMDPPVIGRIESGRVVLDPRTILPEQEASFLSAVAAALQEEGRPPDTPPHTENE